MRRVVAATGNRHKIIELSALFGQLDIDVISKSDAGVTEPDPEETGSTFEENAIIKARAVYESCGEATIADDSGLEVDAIDGAPGIYSARFCETYIEDGGQNESGDAANNRLLLRLLDGVPSEKRTAKFVCAIAFIESGKEPIIVRGVCEGHIAMYPSGDNGFGYDPLFIPDEYKNSGLTFAQLTEEEKNSISHRSRALALLSERF